MLKTNKKKLGDILVEFQIITPMQLTQALEKQKKTGEKLGEVFINEGLVTRESLIQILEFQLGIPHLDLKKMDIDPEAVKKISEGLAKRHDLIPVQINNGILLVAMSDPLNIFAIDDIRIFTGLEVQPAIATPNDICTAIDKYFGKQEAIKAAEEYKKEFGIDSSIQKKESEEDESISNSPIVKLVNTLIENAVRLGASDIHIEPFPQYVRIRYRVDGQLEETMKQDIQLMPAISARIKIMADMNIAERRRPQDGRIGIQVDKRDYDIRVSILPTVSGEKIVMRLTDKQTLLKPKESLGFFKDDLDKFNEILKNPHGMILVTGPTGSGKSTTLYSTLRELNREQINIVTVEDPVEVSMEGINQVQVNTKAGVDFASSLRSILRQDPDIIMIGEIRDAETAEIAVKAAITGHLVVSTIHTNDAASTISRLMDMGVENYLIGTSLVGIIAQRLVKRICPRCKKIYTPQQTDVEILELGSNSVGNLFKGSGCNHCNHTGYSGRVGVYEVLPINSSIRQLIHKGANSDDIRAQAVADGMVSLRDNCKRLVQDGETTIEELVRVAFTID